MTSEGLSRVEVALENDDEDPGELSRLAGLHLGLADVKEAFHRLIISKLYSSFFALPEVQGQEVAAPSVKTHLAHAIRSHLGDRMRCVDCICLRNKA